MNLQLLLIHLLKHKIGILKISIYLRNKLNDRFRFRHKNLEHGTILSEIAAFQIAKILSRRHLVLDVGYLHLVSAIDH